MSTALTPARGDLQAARGTTFGNVLRSEWTKVRSLRSTWWTVLAALVVCIGLSVLIDWAIVANWDQSSPQDRAAFDPVANAFNGVGLGQLAIAVLGVLVVSSEYSTGGVRATFIAVPRRLMVLGAKSVVMALLGFAVGLVIAFVCFLVGQVFFATQDVDTSLGSPGVLRAVIGAALYIAGCGMFGLAVGSVLRHTPGSITAVVALLFVLPLLSLAIPGSIGDAVTKYFTANAGQAVTYVMTPDNSLSPWAGYAAFTVEWLILLVLGLLLLRRRDT
ncbi:MAG TPA: ABC transporter permease [Mycobacteriales bacterium]|jgi:ABC-type transport system involved in multi-copper enzyme maturation permease subunit|nr:ABC transporter permease [Mycobacteriales bacterium]